MDAELRERLDAIDAEDDLEMQEELQSKYTGGTVLHLTCHDQPGLLSRVAAAITHQGLQVHSARIATFGEKVEDTFLVSDQDRQPLSPEAMAAGPPAPS